MKQISAEIKQGSISQTYRGLKQCIAYYQLCKENPSAVKPNELAETKEYAKYVTQNCKKYNIDYKAELRKELGDDKKVAELLKFYGVE
jgi:CRISPR/Cas system-associated exonuclease Cas4 (RecB family)